MGAGTEKVAQILETTTALATMAQATFLDRLPALRHVKEEIIPRDAKRGYFIGLDGRKVICHSEHLMLAGYLQNGEACVQKYSTLLWRRELKAMGIPFWHLDIVHDETQTESLLEYAEIIGKVQRDAITKTGIELGVKCPLTGTTQIGYNWAESH